MAWAGWHPSPVGHLATYPPPPFVCTLCALGQSVRTNIRVWSSRSPRHPRGPGPSPHPNPRPFAGQGHRPQSMFSLRPQQAPGAGVRAAGRGFNGVDHQPVSLGEDPSLHESQWPGCQRPPTSGAQGQVPAVRTGLTPAHSMGALPPDSPPESLPPLQLLSWRQNLESQPLGAPGWGGSPSPGFVRRSPPPPHGPQSRAEHGRGPNHCFLPPGTRADAGAPGTPGARGFVPAARRRRLPPPPPPPIA